MPIYTYKSLRAAGSSGAWFRRAVLLRLAVFLALSTPLVWLAVCAERSQLSTIAFEQSRLDVKNLARAFSEEVNSTISTVDMSLLHLRSHWEQGHEGFAALVERLNKELHGRVIMQVAVTDARGRLVYSNAGPANGIDLSDREHIRVHLQGHEDVLFVSHPVLGRVSGLWSVQFTRPIYHAGKLDGVIVASVAPEYFSRFYSDIDLGPDTSISLVRYDGVVVARQSRNGVGDIGKVVTGYPYYDWRASKTEKAGYFQRPGQLDGIERVYAWRDLPNYPLTVTVGESLADANAHFDKQKTILVRTGAVVNVVLALLGWFAIAASDNRRRAVKALAEAEARWKLALNAAGEGVWDWNLSTAMLNLSPRAQALLDVGVPAIPCPPDTLYPSIHPEDMGRVIRALRDHYEGRTPDFMAEHRVRQRDGRWSWILARGMLVERAPDGAPLRIIGTFANIDERKSAEEQIIHQAHHDALTGLPNRLLFGDRLQQAIRAAQREQTKLAVLYFDLDKFKPVNDTYGHAVGDVLLVEVAKRVAGTLRESDTLARLGGDEFVVLLPGCSEAVQARLVAETVLAQLNLPFVADGHVLNISGSIGFALFPDNGLDSEELLRSADVAMYSAKSTGRGRVCGPDEHLPVAA
ncbi:diguanylate cyclase [Massilia solisilvae]|uniref:Diguanylate cyclase n=1 Tax=Massilia solisilvae TaxID=1811225 RepID=A0ABT2BDZ2_9BURK|nr:diguanylate cyclase [Massilia solisilvae]MCS0606733.1 diguanylate cyclase [Massilia solisilvae]